MINLRTLSVPFQMSYWSTLNFLFPLQSNTEMLGVTVELVGQINSCRVHQPKVKCAIIKIQLHVYLHSWLKQFTILSSILTVQLLSLSTSQAISCSVVIFWPNTSSRMAAIFQSHLKMRSTWGCYKIYYRNV